MERVSNTLQRIMADALRRLPPEQLPEAAWDFAAGKAVAEKTRVVGCNLGCNPSGNPGGSPGSGKATLIVEVPDATWRAQLYAMTPQFLARLNPFLPIERIEFKLAGSKDAPRKA
jgi:hypothetical protein